MKKRVIAMLCTLALVLALLPFSMGAGSYDNIYLVGINDTVMLNLINDNYMPVRRLGVIYAPYTILDNKELGLSYALNKTSGTFTIFNREKTLIFYTTGDGAYDKEGNTYTDRIFARNSNIYLPLRFIANFFGLTYSYYNIPMSEGIVPIARLRNDRSQLTDGQFGVAVVKLASQAVSQYAASHASPTPSAPTVSASAEPIPTPTPTRPPTVIAPATPTPAPTPTPQRLTFSMAISASDGAGFSEILNILEQNHLTVLFLFSPEDLIDRDDDVRSAAAKGHQIGLILGENDPFEDFSKGNRLLKHILRSETTQVYFQGEAAEGSWWVWKNNVFLRGKTAQNQAENLILDLENRTFGRFTLPDSSGGAATLKRLVAELKNHSYTYRIPTESQ